MTCKETIWIGKYEDKKGIFEILVPAFNRDDARNKINLSITNIKEGNKKVTEKIDGEDLIYIEEVGDFDYIRES